MALEWVRLNTSTFMDQKVLTLKQAKKWQAVTNFYECLQYSGMFETEGFIPEVALPKLDATKKSLEPLVEIGLFEVVEGGWFIRSWAEYQSDAGGSKARKAGAQKAANTRWERHRQRAAQDATQAGEHDASA